MANKYIDKYQIIGVLGRGTMGVVYKVKIPDTGDVAALKLFKPSPLLVEKVGLSKLKHAFSQEIDALISTRHINISPVLNTKNPADHLFYLMPYYSRSLGKMIGESYFADRPCRILAIEKTCRFMKGVLNGLYTLHDAGIIHRDIKPFNIMVTDMGVIKIVDFGLSKRRGEQIDLFDPSWEMGGGTPYYSAPELASYPEQADHRVDLFSAGVILYRMLTGILPQDSVETPSKINPFLDSACDEFILKTISHNPDNRYQDGRSMLADLNFLYEKHQEKKTKECVSPARGDMDSNNKSTDEAVIAIRSIPDRVLVKQARKQFNLNHLNQPLHFIPNRFVTGSANEKTKTIYDRTTQLVWQSGGTFRPITFKSAHAYVSQLSLQAFGGCKNWRLPTVEELISLIDPVSENRFCTDVRFSDQQLWVWSADTRSKKAAWVVDLEVGFVTPLAREDNCFVRAVCSL